MSEHLLRDLPFMEGCHCPECEQRRAARQFWDAVEREAIERYRAQTEPLHVHGGNVAESVAWDAAHGR